MREGVLPEIIDDGITSILTKADRNKLAEALLRLFHATGTEPSSSEESLSI